MVAMMGWGVPPEQGWRKGPWTPEEDKLLSEYVKLHGEGRWSTVARGSGLNRSGKSCRLRWVNYLRPGLKRGQITPQEEGIIIELHALWGNKWSTIARYLPGRTDNEIKNYWRTHFKKRERSQKRKAHSLVQKRQQLEQQVMEGDDTNIKRVNPPSEEKVVHEAHGKQEMVFMYQPTMEDQCPFLPAASMTQDIAAWADSVVEDGMLWCGRLWNLDDDDHHHRQQQNSHVDYTSTCNKTAMQNQATSAFASVGDPNSMFECSTTMEDTFSKHMIIFS